MSAEKASYKRVLLKLSGEQFAGKNGRGIDPEFVSWLADEIIKAAKSNVQLAVVVGGGNFIRGAEFAGHGIERATADYMGMLTTVLNGQALMDIMQNKGQATRVMSSIKMEQVAEPFIRRKAIRHMEKGRVVILVGGIGKPYLTTDTAATTLALELSCEAVLKATKVKGVFTKDPAKHDDAEHLEEISFQEAIENPHISVMDKAAMGLAMEQNMPIKVFELKEDNILKIVQGDNVGTAIR